MPTSCLHAKYKKYTEAHRQRPLQMCQSVLQMYQSPHCKSAHIHHFPVKDAQAHRRNILQMCNIK